MKIGRDGTVKVEEEDEGEMKGGRMEDSKEGRHGEKERKRENVEKVSC